MDFDWRKIIAKHAKLIIASTAICTGLALAFALLKKEAWTATQGILVRDEALGNMPKPGRFESTDAMQTAQETILELSRYTTVVKAALLDVGPEPDCDYKDVWPTIDDIEYLQKSVNVSAPGGAQFGRTEMIYLTVKASTSDRAVDLTNAVVDHLERQLQIVRRERYVSIIAELERTVSLAEADLEAATRQIEQIEQSVGVDLASLRDITDNQAGEGSLVREFNDLKRELRTLKATVSTQENLRSVLVQARRDPKSIVATPNRLLDSQPAIKRLKEGLIDAQLATSHLLGIMTPDHPRAKAAQIAEQGIRDQLYAELEVAIRGLDADIRDTKRRVATLESQIGEHKGSLLGVGKLRARYSNLRAEIENKSRFLDQAIVDLAEARANQRASTEVSLITRVDGPIPSSRPAGPGKKNIVFGGLLGGLTIAAGLIFLLEPIGVKRPFQYAQQHIGGSVVRLGTTTMQGIRRSGGGRRATDQPLIGHRRTDALPPVQRELLADIIDHLTNKAAEQTTPASQSEPNAHSAQAEESSVASQMEASMAESSSTPTTS